MTSLLNKI